MESYRTTDMAAAGVARRGYRAIGDTYENNSAPIHVQVQTVQK